MKSIFLFKLHDKTIKTILKRRSENFPIHLSYFDKNLYRFNPKPVAVTFQTD